MENQSVRTDPLDAAILFAAGAVVEQARAGRPWLVFWDAPAADAPAGYDLHMQAVGSGREAEQLLEKLARRQARWPTMVVQVLADGGEVDIRRVWRRSSGA